MPTASLAAVGLARTVSAGPGLPVVLTVPVAVAASAATAPTSGTATRAAVATAVAILRRRVLSSCMRVPLGYAGRCRFARTLGRVPRCDHGERSPPTTLGVMRLKGIATAGTALTLVALALVGCSSDDGATAKEGTPAEQLAAARTNLEKSPAVTFTLAATDLPSKAIGVSGAKGTGAFTPPSFKGTLNATIAGVTGTVEVIAVEQDVYMKFFTPGYNKIDPATYGAPNPAQLFNKETGITSLIGKTAGAEEGRPGAGRVQTS